MLSKYNVITLFPRLFYEWKTTGVISNGLEDNIFTLDTIDLRDYGIGNYKQTDDSPYGGGPGMVMMIEPIDKAIQANKADLNIFLSPSGEQLNESIITKLHKYNSVNVICGRYEGFYQRVIDLHSDYEISIGETVVSGGEIPAMFLMEALIRRLPGVLGNSESLVSESFINGNMISLYTQDQKLIKICPFQMYCYQEIIKKLKNGKRII